MEPATRLPWQVLGVATGLFSAASLITGLTHSGFGDAGPGDVLLLLASLCPPVTCVLLARRVHGRRWLPLVLDGLAITIALLVTADVVLFTPALGPDGVSGTVGAVLVGYGSYAALTIGLAAALCTVSAAALRRSATGVLTTTAFFGLSASVQALYMVHPTGG